MKKLYLRIRKLIKFLIVNSEPEMKAPFLIVRSGQIVSAGKESYHNGNFVVKGSGGQLEIGSYCAIGTDVKIILANHDMTKTCMQYTFYRKNFNLNPIGETLSTTIIENDVWIGDNVIILPGVKIGNGAVLAAGSIVTKDVEPYAIVGGNPARLIRKRFSEERIKLLLESKWWSWDDETIQKNKEIFLKNEKENKPILVQT